MKKLQRKQMFKKDYISFMNDVINKGYDVKVLEEELNRSGRKVGFIQHHSIYYPKKQKIRVIFNCGVLYQGTTLKVPSRASCSNGGCGINAPPGENPTRRR